MRLKKKTFPKKKTDRKTRNPKPVLDEATRDLLGRAGVSTTDMPLPLRASHTYLKLAAQFPIQPIASDDELDAAIQQLDMLMSREQLDEQEHGYMKSLANEIERYEDARYPAPKVSGAAMLRFLMGSKEATLSEVANGTGIAISTLSAVLHKKRDLNLTHIGKLAPYFGVDPGVFVD